MKYRFATLAALAFAGVLSIASAVPPERPNPPGPAGGPGAGHEKRCSIERPHKPHDWKGPNGEIFHCPGVPPR